jgi:nitrate reductase NapE component
MSTQKLDREVLSGEEGGEPGERGTGVRMGRRARHEKASLPGHLPCAANVPGDFVATINWGDTTTTAGVVSGGAGVFSVSGSHTYSVAGPFPVTVTLAEDAPGTATATAVSSAAVALALLPSPSIPTVGGFGLLVLMLSLAAVGTFLARSR